MINFINIDISKAILYFCFIPHRVDISLVVLLFQSKKTDACFANSVNGLHLFMFLQYYFFLSILFGFYTLYDENLLQV